MRRIKKVFDPIVISICSLTIALGSYGYAGYVQYRNLEFLQDSFCGLVEPLASTTPTTPTGITYRDSAARTAHKLDCSPDPTDGK